MNTETFTINDDQRLKQTTTVSSQTPTRAGPRETVAAHEVSYPFSLEYNQISLPDGSFTVVSTSDQKLLESGDATAHGKGLHPRIYNQWPRGIRPATPRRKFAPDTPAAARRNS